MSRSAFPSLFVVDELLLGRSGLQAQAADPEMSGAHLKALVASGVLRSAEGAESMLLRT
jgi:hypothetical protein